MGKKIKKTVNEQQNEQKQLAITCRERESNVIIIESKLLPQEHPHHGDMQQYHPILDYLKINFI